MASDNKLLIEELKEEVLWLTMNHPPANALSNALLRHLVGRLESVVEKNDVAGVVLRGAGDKFFTAGGDVKEFATLSEQGGIERVDLGSRLKVALSKLRCPYVCAVNGAAIGSGMEMAALADYCIASSTARFGMPEINHGLLPMAKGIQQLVRVIGFQNTKSVLFKGDIFGPQRALEMGLVHQIVEPAELDNAANLWISEMVQKPRELFWSLKRTINECLLLTDEELSEMTKADLKGYFDSDKSREQRDNYLNAKK